MSPVDLGELPVRERPPVFASTKFVAPPPPIAHVQRHDLLERIDNAGHIPLTLVIGSPGSGKSSLLSAWFHTGDPVSLSWLSTDRGDHDPVRFWRAFIAALQRIAPGFGADAADLITLDRSVSTDVLESLLADDTELDRRVTLVIDDVHLVSPETARHLHHLVERGLRNLRLVIGSRHDPAIGLHRLRLRHQVVEVRESDLRFGLAETAELLDRLGLRLADADVEALQRRTEGWVAGVQMAAQAVIGTDDPAALLRRVMGNHQTIAGYLTSEVLANQPARIRRFLEDSCVVDELDVEMCEALTAPCPGDAQPGVSPGVSLIEIEDANLLLSRIDTDGTAFRYHPMFSEMLREQFRTTHPDRYHEQHRRAAEVYLRTGRIEQAVRHLWSAGRHAEAARVIHEQVRDVYFSTGAPPPSDLQLVLGTSPNASVAADVAGAAIAHILNGQPARAHGLLDRFESIVATTGFGPTERIPFDAIRVGTTLMLGDTAASVAHMRELTATASMLERNDDIWVALATPPGIRAAVWEGRLDEADELARSQPTHPDRRLSEVDLPGAIAFAALERGDLARAFSLAGRAHRAAVELDVAGSGADLAARAVIGTALVEVGQFDSAADHLAAVLDSQRYERIPSYVLASLARVRLLAALGDFDGALNAITAARVRLGSSSTTLSARIDGAEIAVRSARGDLDRAETLTRHLSTSLRTGIVTCWVDLAAGRLDRAADRLAGFESHASFTVRERLDIALLRARCAIELADTGADPGADVAACCAAVIDAGEESGAVLAIAEAGAAVLDNVNSAARRRILTPYIERLLATRPVARPPDQARPVSSYDVLSPREVVVLRYMATSMSNQEIAEALYLSVNTVKTHVKHVLRKLSSTTRAEAVRRARELRYL